MKKWKLRFIISFILFFACSVAGFAQNIIQGKVLDETTGEPLIGVSVMIQGTSTGTITDIDGKFSLQIAKNETLVFSYVGYVKKTQNVKPGNPFIILKLAENFQQLDEVIVVGYGVQKKVSSVASIVTAKGEDMLMTGNLNTVSEALQGKLNGVVAINTSGKPGDNAADIYIRGKGSWGKTDPLTLVDGIERNMNDVDMNEIESISVLKDASATAVYGVKGANGVILLTTKRGSNKKPKVGFSANFGFKQFTSDMKFADYVTSMRMYNEAAANDQDWSKQIPQSTISAWENAYATGNYGPYNDVFPQVDWWDEMVRKVGFSQNYNLNITGGNDFISYFASVGYQNDGDNFNIEKQSDFDPRYYYKRYNWRSNLDFKLTKSTTFSVNIAGKYGYRNEPMGTNETGELFTPIIQTPTNMFPVKYSDGYWGEGENLGYNIAANVATRGQRTNKSFQGWYDVYLNQNLDFIVKGLSAKAMVGYNSYSDGLSKIITGKLPGYNDFEAQSSVVRYYRPYDYSNPIVNSDGTLTYPLIKEGVRRHPSGGIGDYPLGVAYDEFRKYGRNLTYEISLNYKASFGDNNVTAMAVWNRKINDHNVDKDGERTKLIFAEHYEDWVGRVTYNWKERYLAEVNMAYNGSDKFAKGKRFGFFPSFSVGWRISEEPIIKKLTNGYLSNLKLTYSYGEVGSDANAERFNYLSYYIVTGGNQNFGYTNDIQFKPLYKEDKVGNPASTWETATKQNLAMDIGLWHKLNLKVELFDEKRTGILMKRNTTAAWIAVTLPELNLGETKNHGIDLEMSWYDKIGKNISYNLGFNFSMSENRVVYKDDPRDMPQYMAQAGKPINFQNRYVAVGNFETIDDVFNYAQTGFAGASKEKVMPGDLVFIDYNGDGILNANDKVPVEQLNYPLTVYSFNLGFRYKDIGISAMFYSPRGVYKFQQANFLWDFPMSNVKAQPNTLERWTPGTANNSGVKKPPVHIWDATTAQGNGNSHNKPEGGESTYSYIDHSYFRLKNLEVNYTLPKKLLGKVSIDRCQFYVNGNNLFTLSKIDKRVDPETGGGKYPIVKTFTFGVRLSF